MPRGTHPLDDRALIAEAYRIDGITVEDCRSIFFDWALGLKAADPAEAAAHLLADYAPPPEHPMTGLLREAMTRSASPQRRGGRRGR